MAPTEYYERQVVDHFIFVIIIRHILLYIGLCFTSPLFPAFSCDTTRDYPCRRGSRTLLYLIKKKPRKR
jgi:hypothetical protein